MSSDGPHWAQPQVQAIFHLHSPFENVSSVLNISSTSWNIQKMQNIKEYSFPHNKVKCEREKHCIK